ncbi:MAG: hypothetical protein ACRC0X_06085 [Brevinema sp.]
MYLKKLQILVILFVTPNLGFTLLGHDTEWTAWVGYEQQFGALQNKFITYGGGSVGASIYGLSLGAGVYGNFGYNASFEGRDPFDATMIYGGFIVGYKSPTFNIFRIRLNTVLGYGTIQISTEKRGHFVIAPSLFFDIAVFSNLNLSIGLTYRYFHGSDTIININKPENSFAATVGFAWISG